MYMKKISALILVGMFVFLGQTPSALATTQTNVEITSNLEITKTTTSATFSFEYDYPALGALDPQGFEIRYGLSAGSLTSNTGSFGTIALTSDPVTVTKTISGLSSGTTYYFDIIDINPNFLTTEPKTPYISGSFVTVALAQQAASDGSKTPTPLPSGVTVGLENPIPSITNIGGFVETLLNIVLTIGIPIVAFFIILAGFNFVTARGNPEKLKKAKDMLLYTLIGAALLLGAWVLAEAIQGTVNLITQP